MICLDTHVVVWLYQGNVELIPEAVRLRLEREPWAVSPAVVLELGLLYEIKRLTVPAREMVDDLDRRIGLQRLPEALDAVVARALDMTWTRDPFDRLIVAHAAAAGMTLLTKDRVIRRHFKGALWS